LKDAKPVRNCEHRKSTGAPPNVEDILLPPSNTWRILAAIEKNLAANTRLLEGFRILGINLPVDEMTV